MKRKLLFTLFLLIPTFVSADDGIPSIKGYYAYVSNSSGTAYYNYDGANLQPYNTLKYGSQVFIEYEEKINNVIYGEGCNPENLKSNEYGNYCDKISYMYNLSDLTNKDEFIFNANDENDYNVVDNGIGLVTKDLFLKTGPGTAYKDLSTKVPQNTEVKVTYNNSGSWYYVTYNSISGWVDSYNGDIFIKVNNNVKSSENTPLYKSLSDFNNYDQTQSLTVLEKNTYFNVYLSPASNAVYLKYNNILGYANCWNFYEDAGQYKLTINKSLAPDIIKNNNVKTGDVLNSNLFNELYGVGGNTCDSSYYELETGGLIYNCFSDEVDTEFIKKNEHEIEEKNNIFIDKSINKLTSETPSDNMDESSETQNEESPITEEKNDSKLNIFYNSSAFKYIIIALIVSLISIIILIIFNRKKHAIK